ncbi:MAG: UPF0182 family membrane protein [Acidimicrobiales bacterium]
MRRPEDMPRPERPTRAASIGRGRILLIVLAAVLVVLFVSLKAIATFYTDYLWFKSVGQANVWRTELGTKAGLAIVFIGVFFALLWVNLFIADRIAPRFRPSGPEEELVERYHELIHGHTALVRSGVALLFAVIAGSPASGEWSSWLLFRNHQSFGVNDPQFGKDVGFYVFQLPFLNFVVGWLFVALVIVLIVTGVEHYMNGGIRVQTPVQRVTPQVKAHLSVLLAAIALVKLGGYYFQQFSLTVSSRGTVDGATYTDVHAQLPAIRLLLLISGAAALLFIVNIFRRGWVLPVLGVGLWALVAVLAGTILPTFIQKFRVEPSESSKERPYIERNIAATQQAMNIVPPDAADPSRASNVDVKQFSNDGKIDSTSLQKNDSTVSNIRVWDPASDILQQTYQQLQSQTSFYEINDVDVDRYMIGGKQTQVMISARELNTSKVPQASWEARHMAYTHGYGLVASPANTKQDGGQPDLVVSDIPVNDKAGLGITEPALYFGENLSGYVVVNSKRQEIDYQKGDTSQFRAYAGADGIDVGSITRRAAFALRFGDFESLFSGNFTSQSKILINRDVKTRVEQVAPFLQWDKDPYPTVIDGRVTWIVDGYTTTDAYPYAQRASTDGLEVGSGLRTSFNYVRNAVKATVDAYDGTIKLYVVDSTDPIIKAYQSAFPSLFTTDTPSDELRSHFRYPEDMFKVQTNMWGKYHVSNPDTFYNGSDQWLVAKDPGIQEARAPASTAAATDANSAVVTSSQNRRIDPYYQLMRLPGETDTSFLLLRPFVPFSEDDSRQQLTSFMVAKSDPGSYGKLETFVMPSERRPEGPGLVAGTIQADTNVSQAQTLFCQQGSKCLFGNLVLIPVEQSLLYVRPLYVIAQGNELPLLRKVVVEFQGQVAIADDLNSALRGITAFKDLPATSAAGAPPSSTPPADGSPPTTAPPNTGTESVSDLVAEATQAFADANAALQKNPPDYATYGAKLAEAQAKIKQANDTLAAQGSAGSATTTSTTTTTAPSA